MYFGAVLIVKTKYIKGLLRSFQDDMMTVENDNLSRHDMRNNVIKGLTQAGAELRLFIRGAKINITRYNICFNLLYMSCKTKPA
jgi:hypothetical protein